MHSFQAGTYPHGIKFKMSQWWRESLLPSPVSSLISAALEVGLCPQDMSRSAQVSPSPGAPTNSG